MDSHITNPGRHDVAHALEANISSGQKISAAFACPDFLIPRYTAVLSRVTSDTRRVKDFRKGAAARIDDGDGFPTFAELLVAKRLRAKEWSSAWFSTYGSFQCIDTWAWNEAEPSSLEIPTAVKKAVNAISEIRQNLKRTKTSSLNGITDVVAWRSNEILMIECKRSKEDRLRSTQEEWLHAALIYGVPDQNLGVFEWRFTD